mmetsp:Transcript_59529/g.134283  ORF Transcript_59529/g.134283 Transcript_59529/m.134283 type:complete len:232 (+) Transcript_59529:493-1188(+)
MSSTLQRPAWPLASSATGVPRHCSARRQKSRARLAEWCYHPLAERPASPADPAATASSPPARCYGQGASLGAPAPPSPPPWPAARPHQPARLPARLRHEPPRDFAATPAPFASSTPPRRPGARPHRIGVPPLSPHNSARPKPPPKGVHPVGIPAVAPPPSRVLHAAVCTRPPTGRCVPGRSHAASRWSASPRRVRTRPPASGGNPRQRRCRRRPWAHSPERWPGSPPAAPR